MKKILTIVIPTYNMQDYLRRCLDSLIVADNLMNALEVLVVNDGSKDNSSRIAHEYQDRYPETFRVIDKENGNYGSCVNRGLQEATGVYFRTLDADDYFETGSLERFVEALLIQERVDMIITNYRVIYQNGNRTESHCTPSDLYNVIYQYSDFNFMKNHCEGMLRMHAVTYRTALLKEHNYFQQTGISYTDVEYLLIPCEYIKTFTFVNLYLYSYTIGREGQTVSRKSQYRALGAYIKLYDRLIANYERILESNNENRIDNARNIFFLVLVNVYCCALIYNKKTKDLNEKLCGIYSHVNAIDKKLAKKLSGITTFKLPVFKIWHSTGIFCSNRILVKFLIFLSGYLDSYTILDPINRNRQRMKNRCSEL